MDARIDELERLAALHRSGVLTDEEFAAQKARTLAGAPLGIAAPATASPGVGASPGATAPPQLSKTWQRRFAFFAEHGSPLSGAGALALQKLPFWTGLGIRSNIWGFLFGPIYFFVLGLWKRGLSLAVLALVTAYVGAWVFGDGVGRLVGVLSSILCSMTVNYARYIKVTQGRDEWNPFADMFTGREPVAGR